MPLLNVSVSLCKHIGGHLPPLVKSHWIFLSFGDITTNIFLHLWNHNEHLSPLLKSHWVSLSIAEITLNIYLHWWNPLNLPLPWWINIEYPSPFVKSHWTSLYIRETGEITLTNFLYWGNQTSLFIGEMALNMSLSLLAKLHSTSHC